MLPIIYAITIASTIGLFIGCCYVVVKYTLDKIEGFSPGCSYFLGQLIGWILIIGALYLFWNFFMNIFLTIMFIVVLILGVASKGKLGMTAGENTSYELKDKVWNKDIDDEDEWKF